MDDWQPIETAPKDGREIVVWSRYHQTPVTAFWNHRRWMASWDGSAVIESQCDFGTDYKEPDVPSHWRPNFAPPSIDTQEQR